MMYASDREELANRLRECGGGLQRGESVDLTQKKAQLRALQGEVRIVLAPRSDAQLRAIAFMLYAWIDHYYFNLSGTFPSQISKRVGEIRSQFLMQSAGPALIELADALIDVDASIFSPLAKLFTAYL